jgi:hypothetical protein
MSRKPYLGPSDSQANAEALARRAAPYSAASDITFRIAWDWHKREPRGLRDAADMLRRAYADEVPTRLHNRDLADDGTPHMTPQAEGFIFEDARKTTDEDGAIAYYRTPVRAAMANLEGPRRQLVQKVATGEMHPFQAAQSLGVPDWCCKMVAEEVLRSFMRSLSDIKIALPPVDSVA